MGRYSQINRPMAVTTPLGPDVLLLVKFSGIEALSEPFRYQLEMLAEDESDVRFDELLGQDVTVKMALPDGTKRYFHGIISRIGQGHQIPAARGDATFTFFQAEMLPRAWLLTRTV